MPAEEPRTGAPRAARLPAVAVLLAASVLFSRALGYVREAVLAYQIGASAEADAYRAAFLIPDLLNYFLAGGALSIAFIPFYTRVRANEGGAAAERLLATVLGTTAALAILATLGLWWGAEALVALQFPRFEPAVQALTVRLTRILLPAQIFFIAGGVIRGALMAHGRFQTQALAPVLYNGCIIAGGIALGGTLGAEGFAWGALLGALVGPFLVPWIDALRSGEVRIRLRVAPLDPQLLRYLGVAAPLMLGLSLLTVDEWYDKWFGALLGTGTVAQLGYARQLMLMPVGVLGQALATAALPILSGLWSQGRREELDRVLLDTLRAGLGLGLLAAAAILALAEPLVQLVYQRGRFTPEDAARVILLLRIFALAVPAWIAQQIAVRAFFARGDTWRPMLLGTAVALAAAPLYLVLGRGLGGPGLAAAGVLAMSANALATLLLARRVHGGPALSGLAATGVRAAGVAVTAAAVAAALASALRPEASGALGALLALAVAGGAFGVTALLGVRWVGDAPMRAAVRRILRRIDRRAGALL